jgi:hypothetical protein
MIKAWNVVLKCGRELHGKEIGSFREVKDRPDIVDLYVMTGAGKVHAPRHEGRPIRFDFFLHVALEEGRTGQEWKLVSIYPDHKLIRHVLPDGRNRVERSS